MKAYALEITAGSCDDIRTKVEQVFVDKEVAESHKLDLERRASQLRHRIEMCQSCDFSMVDCDPGAGADAALAEAKKICPYAAMDVNTGEVTCAERTWMDYVPDYRISEIELIGLPEARYKVVKRSDGTFELYLDDRWCSSHSEDGVFVEMDNNYIIDYIDESTIS